MPISPRSAPPARVTRRRFSILFLLVLLAAPLVSGATLVPTTPNFAFDGQHSDFVQQYYARFLAGDSVPQIALDSGLVPDEITDELSAVRLRWGELPGLLQRALLWDFGYAFADSALRRIRTRCGRSMAQIFVSKKAYERIGCLPKACSVPTGEITYRHRMCDSTQASAISLCAAEDSVISSHSDMWGEGADDDMIPDVTLQRHTWTDTAGDHLMYSLHSVKEDTAYAVCPARPALIIPCTPYSLETNKDQWCAPVRGPIIRPWLQNYSSIRKPHNSWIIFEIILVMMFCGSMIYGTCNHFRNKQNNHLLEQELEELREALLVWRQGARKDKTSDATTVEADTMEDIENALDAAAVKYFDSSIGLLASAHVDPHDLLSSKESLELSLERQQSDENLMESGLMISDGDQSFLLDGTSRRQLDRSISSSSAISLLSGRRSQVALRSFHLFESHSLIRRRRVPFRDIQFNELLSQGTSGEVWRCTLRGQEVAVKQLLPTRRRILKEMELFMAEVYLLSQLIHPNIVTLVGVAWNTLEHVVMVQEWMQRGDLQGYLKRQRERMALLGSDDSGSQPEGRCSEDEEFSWENHKLDIAISVARALTYLHGLTPQLLHRDIKSKNVLLSDAMEVKLCDFGISRRKHHMDEEETNLTVTEAAGTMSWTAPEVLMGNDYGEKVDIYSYGIMLCEIDTCVLPYHDPESLESRLIFHPLRLMKLVISKGLRPTISPTCPPKIASLIHACLDGDPENRPGAYEIVTYLSSNDIV